MITNLEALAWAIHRMGLRLPWAEESAAVQERYRNEARSILSSLHEAGFEIEPKERRSEMTEDFRDYPQSVTETKAEKKLSGAEWTARDALISLLRLIDSGEEKVGEMIICYTDEDGGVRYVIQSTKGLGSVVGLLELAKMAIAEDHGG